MSACPDWRRLAERNHHGAAAAREWSEALAHKQSCAACAESSLEVDPLLVFTRAGRLPESFDEDREAAAMIERVRIARRHVEAEERVAHGPLGKRRASEAPWMRIAAALVLASGVGLWWQERLSDNHPGVLAASAPTVLSSVRAKEQPAMTVAVRDRVAEQLALLPLVESVDGDLDIRYQLTGGPLDVVLVVGPSPGL